MHNAASPSAISLVLTPVLALSTVMLVQSFSVQPAWPWWWSAVMGLAWAPLLWLPTQRSLRAVCVQVLSGLLMMAGLTGAAVLAHALPLGIRDVPHHTLGLVALAGMAWLYACLVVLQLRPRALRSWRRWSYAGFYVDEAYTRLALQLWPTRWTAESSKGSGSRASDLRVPGAPR